MNKQVIIVSSVTYAIKSREILFAKGIKAYVERVEKTQETGCGYGVYVPRDTEQAQQILKSQGIRILGLAQHNSRP